MMYFIAGQLLSHLAVHMAAQLYVGICAIIHIMNVYVEQSGLAVQLRIAVAGGIATSQ